MNVSNIEIPVASSWTLPFLALRKDKTTPIDLTAGWVGFTVAYALGEAFAFQLTTANGGIQLTDPANGIGEVRGTQGSTAGATRGGPAVYSLIVKEGNGTIIPIAAGLCLLVDYPGRAP